MEQLVATEKLIAGKDRQIEELKTDLRHYTYLYEKTLKELGVVE